MAYNYKEGKKRINEILKNYMEVSKVDHIPNDESFTFQNAYYGWVTAIFVDIRNSTELFTKESQVDVARIIRSFTSEIIEILRENDMLLEIGIRGDCVYAVYSSQTKKDENDIFILACYVNNFIKMLNRMLITNNLKTISVGIGMSTDQELVIKAGRKHTNINSKVWIGNAVTIASNLSSLGNKEGKKTIIISDSSYSNINEHNQSLCTKTYDDNYNTVYETDAIITGFNDWIDMGMPA